MLVFTTATHAVWIGLTIADRITSGGGVPLHSLFLLISLCGLYPIIGVAGVCYFEGRGSADADVAEGYRAMDERRAIKTMPRV